MLCQGRPWAAPCKGCNVRVASAENRARREDFGGRAARTVVLQLGVPEVQSGPVAQLGARLNGIQEVTGSIPVRSTNLSFPVSISRK
jgi:hypothetical protein